MDDTALGRNNTASFQGYLERKLRPGVWNLWKKQYFVLGGKTFAYYKSKEHYERNQKEPAGTVNFYYVQAVTVVNSSRKDFAFDVVTRSRTIHLACVDGEESGRKWVEALQQALFRPVVSEPIQPRTSEELPIDESVAERFSGHKNRANSSFRIRSLENCTTFEAVAKDDRIKSFSCEVVNELLSLHPEYASETFTEDYF